MARIAGVDLPNNKRGDVGLTYIFGIGRSTAEKILENLEANDLDVDAPKIVRRPRKKLSDIPGQMTLF